jgi:3-deoxy-D-manno-octulosonic acid kinase
MRTLPVLAELPAGYRVDARARDVVAWHEEIAAPLVRAGFVPGCDPPLVASGLAGRRPLFEVRAGGEAFVVRRFRHGGLLRWMTGDRFLDAERPFRELVLSSRLVRAGVPTPLVVAARARRTGAGYALEVVTRRVPDTIDLGHVLGRAWRGELPARVLHALLRRAGGFVAELHAAGLAHADLTPNNVLVETAALAGGPARMWILDLDRATLGALGTRARDGALARLLRFVERYNAGHARPLTRADYARFLHGYDAARWKEDWRAVQAEHRRGRGAHAAGRILQRVFGGEEHLRGRGLVSRQRASAAGRDRSLG